MKRILLVRTDRVGDVLMITPAIRELRLAFPDAFIATLTKPNTAKLLMNNPYLDVILTDDPEKDTFWDVVKTLRTYRFTHGLLFMPTERGAWQMFWSGVKLRIGVGHKLYEVITGMKSVSRNNYSPLKHEADYCLDLVRKLGVVTGNLQPELYLTTEEIEAAKNFLSVKGIEENKIKIVLHTGSFGSAPNWEEEKYIKLIERVLQEFPDSVIMLTAREMSRDFVLLTERQFTGEKVINISGEIGDLRMFAGVINEADVFIGSSTGPAHMADALNKSCVVLHCNRPMNRAAHWGILNPVSENVEVSNQFCEGHCSSDKRDCRLNEGIPVEMVLEKVKRVLEKVRKNA